MRYLFFMILFTISTNLIVGQDMDSNIVLPESHFKRLIQQSGSALDDASRRDELDRMVIGYSLTSSQVKKICEKFITDEARLAFAVAVYPKVTDKENFYEVFDAFGYFSSVMRLYDFVNGYNQQAFQQVVFPDRKFYIGPNNCLPVMPEDDFQILYDQVRALDDDRARLPYAVSVVRNNCVAVSDVMKLALLLNDEALRLDLVKQSYPRLFDLNNLGMASQLFSNQSQRESFRQFVGEGRVQHGFDPLPPDQGSQECSVSDNEFEDMMMSVDKQSFNNTKLSMAKQVLADGKCFTVDQIITMLKAFSFESARLELAKYAFNFCLEKEKYFRVADALDYESSKADLLSFLNGK